MFHRFGLAVNITMHARRGYLLVPDHEKSLKTGTPRDGKTPFGFNFPPVASDAKSIKLLKDKRRPKLLAPELECNSLAFAMDV